MLRVHSFSGTCFFSLANPWAAAPMEVEGMDCGLFRALQPDLQTVTWGLRGNGDAP